MPSASVRRWQTEDGMINKGEQTVSQTVPATANPPPWPGCNHGWSCRSTETRSRNTDPAVYFIIGVVPVLVLAYMILYKYRHHRVVAIIRRIVGMSINLLSPCVTLYVWWLYTCFLVHFEQTWAFCVDIRCAQSLHVHWVQCARYIFCIVRDQHPSGQGKTFWIGLNHSANGSSI